MHLDASWTPFDRVCTCAQLSVVPRTSTPPFPSPTLARDAHLWTWLHRTLMIILCEMRHRTITQSQGGPLAESYLARSAGNAIHVFPLP